MTAAGIEVLENDMLADKQELSYAIIDFGMIELG